MSQQIGVRLLLGDGRLYDTNTHAAEVNVKDFYTQRQRAYYDCGVRKIEATQGAEIILRGTYKSDGVLSWTAPSALFKPDRDSLLGDIVAQGGRRHIVLYGPPGTAKTTTAVRAALAISEKPPVVVTFKAEDSASGLWGHYMPSGETSWTWHDNPLLTAWREGRVAVLNEIDHASEDVSNLMHNFLDDPEVAEVTLPTGETVRPQPGFFAIATMNGQPSDLNAAVRSRLRCRIPVMLPCAEQLAELPPDIAVACSKLYATATDKMAGPQVDYRTMVAFADMRADYGDAAKAAFYATGEIELSLAILEATVVAKSETTPEQWAAYNERQAAKGAPVEAAAVEAAQPKASGARGAAMARRWADPAQREAMSARIREGMAARRAAKS
jgi:hypothetical protein